MATPEGAEDPLAEIGRLAREESLGVGSDDPEGHPRHRCSFCVSSAMAACDWCGARFCPRHGRGRATLFSTTTKLVCSRCIGRERLLGLGGCALLVAMLIWRFSR
jgi:hypothetical protein